MKRILGLVLMIGIIFAEASFGVITWTKEWSSADDGSLFSGSDIEDIQNDISSQAMTTSSDYVTGPATNSDAYVPQWNGANTKILKNGLAVGTAANNLVQLDSSAKLPAVDGSQLTGLSNVVQIVNTQTSSMSTGTTVIPYDNTIPQNNEGDQYMTLAITPTSATNKLKIDVVAVTSNATLDQAIIVALFQDTTADALACAWGGSVSGSVDNRPTITFSYYMTAGTTSATTFKVRIGGQAGTITFNGSGGVAYFGVLTSSITITEIAV